MRHWYVRTITFHQQTVSLCLGKLAFVHSVVALTSSVRPLAALVSARPLFLVARHTTTFSINMPLENNKVEHAADDLLPEWMMPQRTKIIVPTSSSNTTKVQGKNNNNNVVYWMQRDVRVVHNWALLWAQHLAEQQHGSHLAVVYAVAPPGPGQSADGLPPALADMRMTRRHGDFMLGGLEQVYHELADLHIPLHVLMPKDATQVGQAVMDQVQQLHASTVVCDFTPIRHCREYVELQAAPIAKNRNVTVYQVDTHNCVPVWQASDKREYGARTIRPRIHKQVNDYLIEFPELNANEKGALELPKFDRKAYDRFLDMDDTVPAVDWLRPGTKAGLAQFGHFCKNGLKHFDAMRNDPTKTDILSNMSPYLNHGHVSFQHLCSTVSAMNKYANGTKAFIEEGLIRRELSDNFLYYVPHDYDSLDAAYDWARQTLETHANDPREYVYTLAELESAETHEDLWNAAQLQLVREGKLHGFLRMYWAKKILEWTESPEMALRAAQFLNDKYAVDGRDPNGFVGVSWSIWGLHDQGWKEREVFGKIRYMNYNGCKRKFDVQALVKRYKGAAENAESATEKHHGKKKSKKQKTK